MQMLPKMHGIPYKMQSRHYVQYMLNIIFCKFVVGILKQMFASTEQET